MGARSKSDQSNTDLNNDKNTLNDNPRSVLDAPGQLILIGDPTEQIDEQKTLNEAFQPSILEGSVVLSKIMRSNLSSEPGMIDSKLNGSLERSDIFSNNQEGAIGDTSNWSQIINDVIEFGIPPERNHPTTTVENSSISTITDQFTANNPRSDTNPTEERKNISECSMEKTSYVIFNGPEDVSTASWILQDGVPIAPMTIQTLNPLLPPPPPVVLTETACQTDEVVLPPPPPLVAETITTTTTIEEDAEAAAALPLKISFMDFQVNDIALFLPVNEKRDIWMAFHAYKPHRYLAPVSTYLLLLFMYVLHVALGTNMIGIVGNILIQRE